MKNKILIFFKKYHSLNSILPNSANSVVILPHSPDHIVIILLLTKIFLSCQFHKITNLLKLKINQIKY
jgi:hypothetical protein